MSSGIVRAKTRPGSREENRDNRALKCLDYRYAETVTPVARILLVKHRRPGSRFPRIAMDGERGRDILGLRHLRGVSVQLSTSAIKHSFTDDSFSNRCYANISVIMLKISRARCLL